MADEPALHGCCPPFAYASERSCGTVRIDAQLPGPLSALLTRLIGPRTQMTLKASLCGKIASYRAIRHIGLGTHHAGGRAVERSGDIDHIEPRYLACNRWRWSRASKPK